MRNASESEDWPKVIKQLNEVSRRKIIGLRICMLPPSASPPSTPAPVSFTAPDPMIAPVIGNLTTDFHHPPLTPHDCLMAVAPPSAADIRAVCENPLSTKIESAAVDLQRMQR
mmetsp:Transcript_33641/g.49044  ORF Transcript_33641/g.49044 Transcript_33641/m.49044 type:complete len:113 (-) Transcript_33641:1900-2238(-)|eukprot:338039-Ditylum_brightwellii.AAC.1